MKPYYQDDLLTLYHGDCLEIDAWLDADVLVTDPPYGMSYKSNRNKQLKVVANDNDISVRDEALKLWSDKPALVFGTWKQVRPSNARQLIVWDKRGGAGFSGDLQMPWADITEEIYVIGKGWLGPRVPAIYSIPTLPSTNRPNHPTPKPVAIFQALYRHIDSQMTLADCFAGAGASLVAAQLLGRKMIAVEIDEHYCEIIATRLAQQSFSFEDI